MESHETGGGRRDNRMTARRAYGRAGGVVVGSVLVSAVWAAWFVRDFGFGGIHILVSLPTVLLGVAYLLAGLAKGAREIGSGTAWRIWLGAGGGALATVALQTFILGTVFGWRDTGDDGDTSGIWLFHLLLGISTLLVAVGCLANGMGWWHRHRRAGGAEGGA